ncbi:COPI associated [Dacryopinax primogenitus]|uniref:COPI associated n=1 Tax=Dacryopinax primogenitus (strain DJM 731) TaxID=1858805 RepID=M5FTI2_DACPD|nr:COPI associated [Dacryopinax primogenitus]EJT96556.1 COPI associated [Dacryopinax primogenitus]
MDALRSISPSVAFKVANTLAAALLLGGGITHLIYHSFTSIIVGIYAVIFGILVALLEWYPVGAERHHVLYRHASFFYSFIGRGIFYALFGVLLLDHFTVAYVFGGFLIFVGIIFFVLQFVPIYDIPPSMQPPSSAEDAQPVWNADADAV